MGIFCAGGFVRSTGFITTFGGAFPRPPAAASVNGVGSPNISRTFTRPGLTPGVGSSTNISSSISFVGTTRALFRASLSAKYLNRALSSVRSAIPGGRYGRGSKGVGYGFIGYTGSTPGFIGCTG